MVLQELIIQTNQIKFIVMTFINKIGMQKMMPKCINRRHSPFYYLSYRHDDRWIIVPLAAELH